MPIFQYVATDQTGAQSQGNYEAANEEQAYAQLAQYGLTVTQLVAVQVTPEVPSPAQPEKKERKRRKKLPSHLKPRRKRRRVACWLWKSVVVQPMRIFLSLLGKCPL